MPLIRLLMKASHRLADGICHFPWEAGGERMLRFL